MGRPKLPEDQARKNFPIRFSPQEKADYQKAADKAGLALPEWIRKTLTDAAKVT